MKITPKIIHAAVTALFHKSGGHVPSDEDLDDYTRFYFQFDERWRSAHDVLGRRDSYYAQSLHDAGLLCRIQYPRLDASGRLLRIDTVFCRDPDHC